MGRSDGGLPSWFGILAATLLLQALSAFLMRVAPTIGPYLTAEAGLSPGAIGYLAAISTVGSIVFLLIGAPLIRRSGSIRILQVGAALGVVGVLLFALPHVAAIALAVFLIGLGYGPSPAAGSDILQRYTPVERRSLIFSIKQAGVPLGGVAAGLLLPPLVGQYGIWGAIGCCLLLSLIVIALVQPLRASIDTDRNRHAAIGLLDLFAVSNLAAPFRAVTTTPVLLRLALAGMCFSLCQGIWFTFLVTYLVVRLDYSLALSGAVFAVMQAAGIFGRILLGWLADRIGSGRRVLLMSGVASAVSSLLLAMTDGGWSLVAVMALAVGSGIAVSSWNGVQIAEMVRLAPHDVHTTVAGATAIVFCGYMTGPPLFALMLAAGGSFALGFLAVAVVGGIGAWFAWSVRDGDRP